MDGMPQAPGAIWSGGGFTFTASSFSNFLNGPIFYSFVASGVISGNGFDATSGFLTLSAQGSSATVSFSSTTEIPLPAAGLMLLVGLGGLAAVWRRRKV